MGGRLVPRRDEPVAYLWCELVEVVHNSGPGPLADLAAEWAAELARRFEFEPPTDGWVSLDV